MLFSPHDCVFQEMGTWRRIGAAKEQSGLSYLKMNHGAAKGNQFTLACAYKTSLLLIKFGSIIFVWGTHLSVYFKLCFLHCLLVRMLVFFIAKSLKFQNIIMFLLQ